MENNAGAVEQAARNENGWTVVGLIKGRRSTGTLPHGWIAFVRKPVFEGYPAGTASYAIQENGNVIFTGGHYDLTRDDAMSDLAGRASIAYPQGS